MDDTHDTERPPHGPQDDETTLWLLDHIVETDADGRDRFVARLRATDEALADRAAVLAHRQNVFDMLDADAHALRVMPKTPSRLAALAEIHDQSSPIVRFAREIGSRAHDAACDLGDALEPGDAVGPYRMVREIGRGGAGVVYLAERDDIGLQVAFKLLWNPFSRPLPTDHAGSNRAGSERVRERERFHAEQRALARLRHSGIAQVYDAGETTDGRPFVVMELVNGVSVTKAARRLSVPGRVRLFGDLCDAVYHVHARGLAHGDLKPANVLVHRDDAGRPVLKVVDFGVATPLRGASPDASPSSGGAPPLTPAYASPERRGGALPTVASDVYALGVLLGEMFAADALRASDDASTLSPIAAVVRRATAVGPGDRYPDVHALDEALCNAACDAVFASLPVAHAGQPPRPTGERVRPRGSHRDEIEREQYRRNAARRAVERAWTNAFLLLAAVMVAATLAYLFVTS